MEWPLVLGDRLGRVALGAAAGQTVIGDSTTVLIYKLARAAVALRPGRTQVVLDTDNFPTDRYVLEGIAAERGLELVWISTDPASGIRPEQVAEVVTERTALVLFSQVAYRSGWLADVPEITRIAHAAGALAMWDLCHSAGSVPIRLDDWDVDLAVGCTYKYLNGGPGAPAFGYAKKDLLPLLRQPIQGWMGHRASFEMGPGYGPAEGSRALLSGTPAILAMVPLHANLDMLEAAGIGAVREKSLLLTGYALDLADEWLAAYDVEVVSPRDPQRRGGHITLRKPGFEKLLDPLWESGVIPDYRRPDGLRIGPAPLSTSFGEVYRGLSVMRSLLEQ
jgi:kynureninase